MFLFLKKKNAVEDKMLRKKELLILKIYIEEKEKN
jgi:hypothetical protein